MKYEATENKIFHLSDHFHWGVGWNLERWYYKVVQFNDGDGMVGTTWGTARNSIYKLLIDLIISISWVFTLGNLSRSL